MKALFSFIFFILIHQFTFGQNRSNCSNFNSFIESELINSIENFAASIDESGIIVLDPSTFDDYNHLEILYPFLGLDSGITFQMVKVLPDQFYEDRNFLVYEQFYQGVKIAGGGYTVSAFIPDEPGDPCSKALILYPQFLTNINISTVPTFGETSLQSMFPNKSNLNAELVLHHNLSENCGFNLTWELFDEGELKIIDAHNGSILASHDTRQFLNAPLETVGPTYPAITFLSDSPFENGRRLVSEDDRITTVDFGSDGHPLSSQLDRFKDEDDIPFTNLGIWTETVADASVYQAHYVISEILPIFQEQLDVNFQKVFVGSIPFNNALAYTEGSDFDEAFISFGRLNGGSTALFDIAAHEMGHVIIHQFGITSRSYNSSSMEEALADMIGVYIESIVQGVLDWGHGDDIATDRDLENPEFDCYDDVKDFEDGEQSAHTRGVPLGHWFYLIVEGDAAAGYEGLGVEKAIKLVLNSIPGAGSDPDYKDVKASTIVNGIDIFGVCSAEMNTVRWAWEEICVGPVSALDCDFEILGPHFACEDDPNSIKLQLNAIGGPPQADFIWQFPFGWTVDGAGSQNWTQGTTFTVRDFPKYDWYPRSFNLKVYPIQDPGFIQTFRVTVRDCLGDDPTCAEFYSQFGGNDNTFKLLQEDTSISQMKVFDVTGRTLYFGVVKNMNDLMLPTEKVLLVSYLNQSAELIETRKMIILDY